VRPTLTARQCGVLAKAGEGSSHARRGPERVAIPATVASDIPTYPHTQLRLVRRVGGSDPNRPAPSTTRIILYLVCRSYRQTRMDGAWLSRNGERIAPVRHAGRNWRPALAEARSKAAGRARDQLQSEGARRTTGAACQRGVQHRRSRLARPKTATIEPDDR